jgi:hypothetical protein
LPAMIGKNSFNEVFARIGSFNRPSSSTGNKAAHS